MRSPRSPGSLRSRPVLPLLAAFFLAVAASGRRAHGEAPVDADFWPQHGHDARRSGRATAAGPIAPVLKWSYTITNQIWGDNVTLQDNASPVIGPDGTVYLGTNDDFYAINPDGTLRWYRYGLDTMRCAPALSPDGGTVYASDGSGRVWAMSAATGATLWQFAKQGQSYSSFAVGPDGTVYCAGTTESMKYAALWALDPDGTMKWRFDSKDYTYVAIESPPAIGPEGNVYFVINVAGLHALNANGQLLWKDPSWGSYGWPTPTVGPDGTIYLAGEAYNGGVAAAEAYAPDGTKKWSRGDVGRAGYFAGMTVSPEGATVYRPGLDGSLVALDAATGATRWVSRVSPDAALGGTPALAGNGILYTTSTAGVVHAVSAANGTPLWSYATNSPTLYWGPPSPALAPDGTLVVASCGAPRAWGDLPAVVYAFRPSTCTDPPDAKALCLNQNRFRLTVRWRNYSTGAEGDGQAVSFTPVPNDSGTFWFFWASNVELLVKVLDGRGVNGHFWVMYGALSDVEYTLTVLDTVTGLARTYVNPAHVMASAADVTAFPAPLPREGEAALAGTAPPPPAERPSATAVAPGPCVPDTETHCLAVGRFEVRVAWSNYTDGTTGSGKTKAITDDTGAFWFFDPKNIELALKVLDGTSVNGKFWVLYGALSDVGYTITIRDGVTGNVRTYVNQPHVLASAADVSAF